MFVKKEERNDLYKTYINWNKNEESTRFWTGTLQSAPKSVFFLINPEEHEQCIPRVVLYFVFVKKEKREYFHNSDIKWNKT